MSLKVALERIQEATKNNASKLDLSNFKLTEIPSEISKITPIIELNLSENQLTEIKGLENLTQLTSLNLSGNKLILFLIINNILPLLLFHFLQR